MFNIRARKFINFSLRLRRFSLAPQYKTATNLSYLNYLGNHPLLYRTIGEQLALTAKQYGDRIAFISSQDHIRYSYAEVLEQSDRLAASFRLLGLEIGDRIGLWAPNTPYWIIAMFAAARAGLVLVPINPALQAVEVGYCINKVNIKAIIAEETFKKQNYYEIFKSLITELETTKPGQLKSKKFPSLRTIVINSYKKLPGSFQLNELLSLVSENDIKEIERIQSKISPDSPCNLQFTSGTTGSPKATYLSHFSYVNNSFSVAHRNELDVQHHIALIQMPFFHAYAIVLILLAGLHFGTTNVSAGLTFNAKESFDAILKEKCTFIYGIPTMYVDLIKYVKSKNTKLNTLEIGLTGGAPCSPKLFVDIKEQLGVKKMNALYGLTEVTACAFQSLPSDDSNVVLNTVGHIQDNLEAKVIDEGGQTVPFGTPGELCIRGYSTMIGYWNDPNKTKEVYDESKWLKTGDKFILYENGYGQIVGRIKDMIIRGGENLFPKEIEDFLNTHPSILESHVIGVPDERMGEEVCAYIRLADHTTLTLDELKSFCKNKLAHFKIPRYIRIVDQFPKTLSGKVQKFKLREEFQF